MNIAENSIIYKYTSMVSIIADYSVSIAYAYDISSTTNELDFYDSVWNCFFNQILHHLFSGLDTLFIAIFPRDSSQFIFSRCRYTII